MLMDELLANGLSRREAEVADLVRKSLANKEVANTLFVTEKTVKFHLTNIYKKLKIKSRAQLIVWCFNHLQFIEEKPKAETPKPVSENTNPWSLPIGKAGRA